MSATGIDRIFLTSAKTRDLSRALKTGRLPAFLKIVSLREQAHNDYNCACLARVGQTRCVLATGGKSPGSVRFYWNNPETTGM